MFYASDFSDTFLGSFASGFNFLQRVLNHYEFFSNSLDLVAYVADCFAQFLGACHDAGSLRLPAKNVGTLALRPSSTE